MTNTEKNEMEQKMETIKTENINYLSTIQQLKCQINEKDQEINDIGMSLISMQNDINHLQSQSQSNNSTVNQYQNKLKQSQQQTNHYKNQYKQVQQTPNTKSIKSITSFIHKLSARITNKKTQKPRKYI